MWQLIKTRAVLIGLLFLLQGCGAKWHLNRAVAKDPTILEQVAVKVDTTIITEIKAIHDTLVLKEYDTIEIQRNGVRVQINRLYDTIQVTAQCLPDTIQVVQEVKVPQVVYDNSGLNKKYIPLLLLCLIAYTLAILKYSK